MICFLFVQTIRQIRTLSQNVNCTNIKTFLHFVKIMFFLRKSIIIFFELKIFIFIKRFVLKLLITCIFLMNLIIIDFFFVVFSFMKKKSVIYLFMKYRLKPIPRKVIANSYLFIIKKDMSRFKNNLLLIFIKHLVFK